MTGMKNMGTINLSWPWRSHWWKNWLLTKFTIQGMAGRALGHAPLASHWPRPAPCPGVDESPLGLTTPHDKPARLKSLQDSKKGDFPSKTQADATMARREQTAALQRAAVWLYSPGFSCTFWITARNSGINFFKVKRIWPGFSSQVGYSALKTMGLQGGKSNSAKPRD